MKNKPFSQAVELASDTKLKFRTSQSLNWYRQYVRTNMSNINNWEKIRNTGEVNKTFKIQYGGLYTFMYDPKYKDELPYYDASPLVIPFTEENDSFLAFNLHYLPLNLRARVMDHLFTINNMKGWDSYKNARRYELFSEMGRNPLFAPCIKRYLKTHLRSRFLEFKPEHWEIAVFLPTANFKKASMSAVHADSRKIIAKQHGR